MSILGTLCFLVENLVSYSGKHNHLHACTTFLMINWFYFCLFSVKCKWYTYFVLSSLLSVTYIRKGNLTKIVHYVENMTNYKCISFSLTSRSTFKIFQTLYHWIFISENFRDKTPLNYLLFIVKGKLNCQRKRFIKKVVHVYNSWLNPTPCRYAVDKHKASWIFKNQGVEETMSSILLQT